jgi:SHS2 domain-containing protein
MMMQDEGSGGAVPRWEHFRHEADVGVRGVGRSKAEAFEQAALALTAVLTDPAAVRLETAVEVGCSAPGDEHLLVDWLSALVYEMATRRLLFGRFEVRLDGGDLRATAWGEPVDRDRHQPAVEVKGATYTQLAVRQEPDGAWLAQCVVDV